MTNGNVNQFLFMRTHPYLPCENNTLSCFSLIAEHTHVVMIAVDSTGSLAFCFLDLIP